MWIFSQGSYLALVQHREDPNLMLVRARRREDILRVFPGAKVEHHPAGGYQFHSAIHRDTVALRVVALVQQIDYPAFTESIPEAGRREAYQVASSPIEAWGRLLDDQADSLGLGSPDYAPAPPRRAWGPLRANLLVLEEKQEAWDQAVGPIQKLKAAYDLEMAVLDLGFVPDGLGQFPGMDPLPQRQDVEKMGLDQALRTLNYVQRLAKWVYEVKGFTTFLESGLVPALIHRMVRLTS
jgi:hypothetical protein